MNGRSPKVSIVIPVFNAGYTLENTLQSIIDQTYSNKEIIVIDNCSTDNSAEILSNYSTHITHQITEQDKGIYDAMNKAINYCTGDWVYFIGADDQLYSKTVLADVFTDNDFDPNIHIIYGSAYYIHRKKTRFGKMNRYRLAKHNINHQAVFYPTKVFKDYSYQVEYKLWADYLLNISLFFKSKYRFAYKNIIIANFNDQGSSGNNDDLDFIRDRKKIINKIFPIDVLMFYYARALFLFVKSKVVKISRR